MVQRSKSRPHTSKFTTPQYERRNPDFETTFWVVEKVEEWTGKKHYYKLVLRAFPLTTHKEGPRKGQWKHKFTPRAGVLVQPVSSTVFHFAKVGQKATVKIFLGGGIVTVPESRKDAPVAGARKLSKTRQKTEFTDLDA
jgi:hypothetical protein